MGWQDVAAAAQSHRDESVSKVTPAPEVPDIPSETLDVSHVAANVLTKQELQITEAPAESLVLSLALGKLSSVQVASAFLKRAALAQKLVSKDCASPALINDS